MIENLGSQNANITSRGWEAFSYVLCNTSIYAIQKSNHILKIDEYDSLKMSIVQNSVDKMLQLNKSYILAGVASHKVIHFYKGINIATLVNDLPEMKTKNKLMTSVVSWLGKREES